MTFGYRSPGHFPNQWVRPDTLYDIEVGYTLAERQANVLCLADVVLNHPEDWGILEPYKCEALAARLIYMRRLYRAGLVQS